jgi:hypothetical protein
MTSHMTKPDDNTRWQPIWPPIWQNLITTPDDNLDDHSDMNTHHTINASYNQRIIQSTPHTINASYNQHLIQLTPHTINASYNQRLIQSTPHTINTSYNQRLIQSTPHTINVKIFLWNPKAWILWFRKGVETVSKWKRNQCSYSWRIARVITNLLSDH